VGYEISDAKSDATSQPAAVEVLAKLIESLPAAQRAELLRRLAGVCWESELRSVDSVDVDENPKNPGNVEVLSTRQRLP
jgi:hypothetical protein